ncbi:hypothetical protein P7D93_20305, partial [Enterococcus raffinosus]|nr:hypothetical protein [Enterococcus raffinosus]
IVIPPAIFFYYSTLSDSRFKTLQQNLKKDFANKTAETLDMSGTDKMTARQGFRYILYKSV